MNSTPLSTPSGSPTTGERALVLGGGGSTGNAWLIGVIAGLFDAGLDVTTADLTIGTSAGSTAAAQVAGATPPELFAATLVAPPQRTAPVRPTEDASGQAGREPSRTGPERSSPPPRTWPTCVARWARPHSTWRPRLTAPGRPNGVRPSPHDCPVSTGRSVRCSSRRSTPRPAIRSCSTATAGSTWRTRSPRAAPAASPTGSATADSSTAATGPTPRTPIWPPGTRGCWCCPPSAANAPAAGVGHASGSAGRRAARSRQQGRDDLPRRAAPSTCSAPTRWTCRYAQPPLKPGTTEAQPWPGDSPSSGE